MRPASKRCTCRFGGARRRSPRCSRERADFYFSPLTAALPFLKDGKLQALAVSGSQRASALPDVPTVAEAGYPEATYNFWVGLFAPSKTPAPIMERSIRRPPRRCRRRTLKERYARMGFDLMPLDRAGFAKLIQDEFVLNTKVAKAAGVKAN